MMQMLEDSGIPYDVYQWARSEYGLLGDQHALCDKIVPPGKVIRRISISDDFSRGPFADIYFPQEKDAMTLGSPESLFAAIPIFLAEGYRTFLVGNERSSDTPNLVYDGQDINHQWIKSLEAEWLANERAKGLADKTIEQMKRDVELLHDPFPTANLLTHKNVEVFLTALVTHLQASASTIRMEEKFLLLEARFILAGQVFLLIP
jgi:hypothetical protein